MKSYFIETLIIGMLPISLKAANVVPWVVLVGGVVFTIWVLVQIVWRIKNWNKDR